MLQIDDRLASYRIGAGEPWIMSVQMKMMAGSAIINWSQRRLVLSFYEPGRVLFHQIEGVYSSDPSGAYFAFVRDGRFSESLLGRSVQVELAERTFNGRDIIATGSLSVSTSSAGVASFGSIIGRVEARFTLYFTASNLIALVEQELLPYGGIPITPGPVIDTPAAINSDGTPQVGETFILVRPTGNGPVVAERLLENGIDVFGEVGDRKFTGRVAGPLRYEADLQGPDGTILTSGSDIVVQAATALRTLTLSTTEATVGQPYTATVAPLYDGTDYLQRVQDDRDGVSIAGSTLSGTFASVVPDITITEALYVKTAPRGTVTVQAAPVTSTVTFGDTTITFGNSTITFGSN